MNTNMDMRGKGVDGSRSEVRRTEEAALSAGTSARTVEQGQRSSGELRAADHAGFSNVVDVPNTNLAERQADIYGALDLSAAVDLVDVEIEIINDRAEVRVPAGY